MAEMASQLAALHAAFFGLYNFDYDRNKSPLLQFDELAAQRQWQLGSNRWKAAYRRCFGIDPPSEEDYRRSQDSAHRHAGEDDDLNPQLANLTLQSANLSTQAPQLGDRAMGQSSASATQLTTQTSFTPARQTIVHSVTPMLQPATLQPANAAVAQSAHPAPVHTGASTTQAQATHPVAQPASSAPMHPTNPLAVKKAQVVAMFTQYYGANASKLDKWQMLCSDCGVDPVPRSITGCKKALRTTNMNIFLLLDAKNHHQDPAATAFGSKKALRQYMKTHKKSIYPLKLAKGNEFLKVFLISMRE